VQKPGLKEFIEQQMSKSGADAHEHGLRVLTEAELVNAKPQPQTPGGKQHGLAVLVRDDLVIASPGIAALQAFNAQLHHGSAGFASTPFAQRLQQAYQGGAGLLFGADLQQLARNRIPAKTARGENAFQQTGLADVRYLIAERKDTGGQTLNRAELTFTGPRHGVASWLAAPAPIGGLDFVSANAGAAGAIVTKSPVQIFDDILNIANAADGGGNAGMQLAMIESQFKIRLREDLARTLGGELTVALDGPILPTPSWKVIVEVNDSARLQQSIQQLVTDLATQYHEAQQVTLTQQNDNGITYYTFRAASQSKSAEIDYAFNDGYLILAPSRALVMEAIQVHKSGNALAKSEAFHKLLPPDKFTNASAVLYQNLAPVLGPVAQQLSPQQAESFRMLSAETQPSVVCAYGEENAIHVASVSRFFGMDLNTLALSSLLKLTHPGRHARLEEHRHQL
jgi:hypothetical protein